MVSVIIPCFNSAETIAICIRSVLQQSYQNLEIIIVEDGSSDNSFNVINAFLEHEKPQQPVSIFQQENQGPSAARNKGIELAKGEWIAFLDSDDCWNRDKLQIQMDVIENDNEIALTGGDGYTKKFSENVFLKRITFSMLLYRNYFTTSTVIVRKEILNNIRFSLKQKYSEDYDVWLLIAYQYKCIYINNVLSRPVLNKQSYGDSGLSANLWAMQMGEISNYTKLYREGYISIFQFLLTTGFSFLKFLIRIVNTMVRK